MKKSFKASVKHSHSERGSFLIPLAAAIVVLLGISFYVIDMALIFKARYDLQVACDAAVARALSMISANPHVASLNIEKIIEVSEETANDNLMPSVSAIKHSSWNPDVDRAVIVDIDFSPELVVTASGSIDIDTWLIDKLPLGFPSATVDSVSKGKKKKIAVALVMDLSGSMDSEVIDQEEQCEDEDSGEIDCTDSKKKYEYLRESAKEFIQAFGAYLDGTVIVTFSNNANPTFSKATPLNPTDISDLLSDFDQIYPGSPSANYRVGGGTNMALALRKARVRLKDFLDEPGWEDAFPVIILLSDGAPTTCSSDFPCAHTLCSSSSPCDGGFGWDRDTAPYMTFVIDQADEIREEDGITIYSIGIGAPALDSPDPYQTTCNSLLLKSFFLRRMSNDPAGWNDEGQFEPGLNCVEKHYEDIVDQHHGVYVQSFGSNLSPILKRFGEMILTQFSS